MLFWITYSHHIWPFLFHINYVSRNSPRLGIYDEKYDLQDIISVVFIIQGDSSGICKMIFISLKIAERIINFIEWLRLGLA